MIRTTSGLSEQHRAKGYNCCHDGTTDPMRLPRAIIKTEWKCGGGL